MSHLPELSNGVLLSGPRTMLAYDVVTETLHRLNGTGLVLLDACDGVSELDELVGEFVDTTFADADRVRADIRAALEDFTARGILGRRDAVPGSPTPSGTSATPPAPCLGVPHPTAGRTIRFEGDDVELLAALDAYVGPGVDAVPAPVRISVRESDDGTVELDDGDPWVFATRGAMFDQVPSILNRHSHVMADVVALHAAGLVRPDGTVFLFPATSGAGKSTLAAHLVAAGWAYLSDETIGIRASDLAALPHPKPLALDQEARRSLGLEATERHNTLPREIDPGAVVRAEPSTPVDVVVFPRFEAGATLSITPLDHTRALEELIANTLNLASTLQLGMDSLDALAERASCYTLVHGDAHRAARVLSDLDT